MSSATSIAPNPRLQDEIQAFDYPSAPSGRDGRNGNGEKEASSLRDHDTGKQIWSHLARPRAVLKYSEEDLQTRLATQQKAAREQGSRACEARMRAEFEEGLKRERQRIADALAQFGRERQAYFETVETEVVQLALGIARKIMHWEAQVDPLLLSGVVRVALEQVAAGSTVKLRVTENEAGKWGEIVNAMEGPRPQPKVTVDPTLPEGSCLLETNVGSTDISLDHQLREVERGLLDLVAPRQRA